MAAIDAPLVVIVGPTASGKTSLAIELAERFDGEIVCADSRTVYRGMDVGTAKPTTEERARVPHWGLDLVDPGERFTAAQFKEYAESAIADIRSRGKTPFLVGGTGLYVDAVLFDYSFGPDIDSAQRDTLNNMSVDELIEHCKINYVMLPENERNKRHLIRAIERNGVEHKRNTSPIVNSIVVGISTDRDTIFARIAERAEHIFEDNVVDEAIRLGNKYGWESEAMTGNIYPLVKLYIDGQLTKQELKDKFIVSDRRLAKRQMTWLRRNTYIEWLSLVDARSYLEDKLTS